MKIYTRWILGCFMRLRDRFSSLKFYQKIELYILVVIFYSFCYYMLSYLDIDHKKIKNSNSEAIFLNKIDRLKESISHIDKTSAIKLIESVAVKKEIDIYDMQIKKRDIVVKARSGYQNGMWFLYYLQNHFFIKQFELNYDKKILDIVVTVDISYLYDKNINYQKLETIPNPFVNVKNLKHNFSNKEDIKLTAIVASMVCIDNKWYKKGDIVDGKRVVAIGFNSVELEDIKTLKRITTKVYNEK